MHSMPERKLLDHVRDIARASSTEPAGVLTTPLVGGDVVGSHLIRVANQKLATGDRRIVPRLAFDSGEGVAKRVLQQAL